MSYYPTFDELIGGTDSTRLLEVRRSFRSVISSIALFVFCAAAVYVLNYFFADARIHTTIPVIRSLSTRWLAIIPALVLLEIFRKYHDDLYVFAAHRITHYEGRLSLYSTLPSLKYVDILSITVRQDIWGRLLDYGNIELDSAGTSEVELTISGVRRPAELALIADQFRVYSTALGSIDQQHEQEEAADPDDDQASAA